MAFRWPKPRKANVVGGGGGFSKLEPTPPYQAGVSGTTRFHGVEYLTPTDFRRSPRG